MAARLLATAVTGLFIVIGLITFLDEHAAKVIALLALIFGGPYLLSALLLWFGAWRLARA